MFIGSLGTVVFRVSRSQIRTFRNFERKRKAKSAKHDVLEGLPRLQHTGRDLDEITLSIVLERMSNYDFTPDSSISSLLRMVEIGDEIPLMLGFRFYGLWFVQEVSPSHKIIHRGTTWRAEVAITLTEYDLTPSLDALATVASSALGGLAGDAALAALDTATGLAASVDGVIADGISGLSGIIAEGASSLTAFVADGVMSLNGLVADGLMNLNELVPEGVLDLSQYIPAGVADINSLVTDGLLDLNNLAVTGGLDLSTLASSGVLDIANLAAQGALNVDVLVSEGVSDMAALAEQGMSTLTGMAGSIATGVMA